jgi:cell division protein FtsI (penicillin-binding protein 3)
MQPAIRAVRSRANAPRIVPLNRRRFWLICGFFLFWVLAIIGRMCWLMIVRHPAYELRAERQQMRTFKVAPQRGIIYDRNLQELAMTIQVESIYADPAQIANKHAAARKLAAIVHTDPQDPLTTAEAIDKRLEQGRYFAWVARRVPNPVAAKVRALHMPGIYFQKEFKRFYPDNDLAAQVLGYVGMDDNGLGGIEAEFNKRLRGKPGVMYTAVDARSHVLGSTEHDPQPGQNLVLTLDSHIQFMAEQALQQDMERTHALHGTVVVQDVHTGQILALANRPTFNPNKFQYASPEVLDDRAVTDVYEPGSTFKIVTYSGALQDRLANLNTMLNCHGGKIDLHGVIIHDDQSDWGLGIVPIETALARSSDVAAIDLALRLGPQRLYHFMRDFGFGQRTGIRLPGESPGLLRPVSDWEPVTIGYMAMGQGVAVTPIQLVTMVSTVANGGVYLPPHILMPGQLGPIRAEERRHLQPSPVRLDEEVPNPLPHGAHRVISERAAAEMRELMRDVVLSGTGKNAQLDGYSSAGKTGTAQKVNPKTHLYSKTNFIGSFVGFAPATNPVIAIAVVIDSPKGDYYGAAVAAPVFAQVAQEVLQYLGVPYDMPLQPPKTESKPATAIAKDASADSEEDIQALYDAANHLPSDSTGSTPASAGHAGPQSPAREHEQQKTNAAAGHAHAVSITIPGVKPVPVPSLTGLSLRKAIEKAASAGLKVEIVGDGIVRQQVPTPGTRVPPGTRLVVQCTR